MNKLRDKLSQIRTFQRFRIIRLKSYCATIQKHNSILSSLDWSASKQKDVKSGRSWKDFSMGSKLVVLGKLGKSSRESVSCFIFRAASRALLSPRKVSFFTFAAPTLLRKLIRIRGSGNVFTSAWITDRRNERIVCPRQRKEVDGSWYRGR